ncbi:MAG TPA: hypothetical protein VIL72_02400 [Beijerinckiaceae bacterium]
MSQAASGVRAGLKHLSLACAGLALAGCAGATESFGGLFGSSAPAPAQTAAAPTAGVTATGEAIRPEDLPCPYVDIRDGGAAHRVYAGGQGSANVRYQFSMGDVVRTCRVEGGQLLLKVGVEGKVLLGPAGSPSSFTVPIAIAVRREAGNVFVTQRKYNVAASIPAGSAQTAFAMVSEEIAVPFVSPKPIDDYQIFIGFETAGAPTATAERRRRR